MKSCSNSISTNIGYTTLTSNCSTCASFYCYIITIGKLLLRQPHNLDTALSVLSWEGNYNVSVYHLSCTRTYTYSGVPAYLVPSTYLSWSNIPHLIEILGCGRAISTTRSFHIHTHVLGGNLYEASELS